MSGRHPEMVLLLTRRHNSAGRAGDGSRLGRRPKARANHARTPASPGRAGVRRDRRDRRCRARRVEAFAQPATTPCSADGSSGQSRAELALHHAVEGQQPYAACVASSQHPKSVAETAVEADLALGRFPAAVEPRRLRRSPRAAQALASLWKRQRVRRTAGQLSAARVRAAQRAHF
jgi:hypothetical protein